MVHECGTIKQVLDRSGTLPESAYSLECGGQPDSVKEGDTVILGVSYQNTSSNWYVIDLEIALTVNGNPVKTKEIDRVVNGDTVSFLYTFNSPGSKTIGFEAVATPP